MNIFQIYPMQLATDADIRMILDIRNQEQVRNQMYNPSIITIDTHLEWWSRKSHDSPGEFGYIVRSGDLAVGFFRFWFDPHYNAGNWSMFTNTQLNNKKLGVYTEYNALSYFFKSPINKTNQIISEVKDDNLIIKLHKKIGFKVEISNQTSPGWLLMRNNIDNFTSCKHRFESVLGLSS